MALAFKSSTEWSDKRCMSQAAYEARLDRGLAHFKDDLENFMVGKETFLEDFYRRLKEVLGRCKSWRCQGALGIHSINIASRKQIEELIRWEQSMRTVRNSKQPMPSGIHGPKCMLVQFVEACDESVSLHEEFIRLIYKPLHDVFYEERIKPLAKELGRILWRWKTLLGPGPLNHRLFSPESAKALYYMNVKHKSRGTHFNLVLRLIPDLMLKSYECLELAREWRGCLGAQGYAKQMEQTMRQWQIVLLDQERNAKKPKDEDPSPRTLEAKLEVAEQELQQYSSNFQTLDDEVNTLEDRIDEISSEQEEVRKTMKSACEEKIVMLRAVSRSKQDVDFLRGKVKMEQRQLRIVKDHLLNTQTRKSVHPCERGGNRLVFEKRFKDSQERCRSWQKDLANAEQEYNSSFGRHASVHRRLNSARTEMDVSKSQKVLLSRNLDKSREKKEAQAKKRIQSANQIRGIRAELRHVNSCPDTRRREKRDDEQSRPGDVNVSYDR